MSFSKAVVVAFLFAGCTWQGKPAQAPQLDSVFPPAVFNDGPALVQLNGARFPAKATSRWGGANGGLTASTRYEVFAAGTALEQVQWVDANTLTARVPAGLAAGSYGLRIVDPFSVETTKADALTVRDRAGASLAATLSSALPSVQVLHPVTAFLDVTNTGDSALGNLSALQLAFSGTADVTVVGVTGGAGSLDPGASTRFTLTWVSTQVGTLTLQAEARGSDVKTGKPVSSGTVTAAEIQIVPPPELIATLIPARAVVSRGQVIDLVLEAKNIGQGAVLQLSPAVSLRPATRVNAKSVPVARDLAAGATQTFAFSWDSLLPGEVLFRADGLGTDAASGGPIAMAPAFASVMIVTPAALSMTLTASPAQVGPGQRVTLTARVTNGGQAKALNVTPIVSGTAGLTLVSAAVPATVGATPVDFVWQYDAVTPGTVQPMVTAGGTDENSGLAVSAAASATVTITSVAAPEVVLLATDPFADGTSFSYVFAYRGKVFLGPRQNGRGAVSMNPDGTGAANISFSFPRDSTVGAVSLNTSAAPFPSIGTEGCAVNTPACGPNNENARGLFFSGTIFGVEFLGIGGAHATGKLQYLYLSEDTDATIDFRFLDIWAGSGGSTKGVSAAHTLGDRLYFGMQDTGGNKPYFFALVSTVQAPGLNAVVGLQPTAGTHVLDLQGDELPDLGQKMGNSAPVVLIDSITDFNARIYVANNGGMVRATTNLPLSPAFAPGHWVKASPTRVEFTAKASVTTPKTASLLPSDRAFPAMVSFKGRLYAARNTTTGPQLWGCDPQGDLACDPADWILIAANGQGDTQLTQLNDAANTTIGLLAATANTLFIGFNNASGVQIFKTTAATPTLRSDFTGQLGCVAGVAGCNGLGGKGLGAPATNTRILDAKAMTFNAQSWLYVVAGNATAPVQVFRVSP